MSAEDTFGLVGTALDGKYDVACVVAEGGFGVVYQAVHRALQKRVAVKVLKMPPAMAPAARTEFFEKFVQEARMIAHLDHPAIVRVLDFGASPMPRGEPAPWTVLEWLDGQTLEAFLDARGEGRGASPAETLALLGPVFAAIAHAHDEGIVHRDLKPANVMLVRNRRGEVTARVLDFGIAKVMGAEQAVSSGHTATATAVQSFTPTYAAPEQFTAMRTGPWTDVHALALIVVEVLTGRAPFAGADLAELYAAALSPVRPTPAQKGLEVGAWEPVLARALAFKPGDRFAHAGAFFAALRDALPGATAVPLATVPPRLSGAGAQGEHTLRGSTHPTAPGTAPGRGKVVGIALAVSTIGVLGAALTLARPEPIRPAAAGASVVVAPPPMPRVAVAQPRVVEPPAPFVAVTPPSPPTVVDAGARVVAVPSRRTGDRAPRSGSRAIAPFDPSGSPAPPRATTSTERLPVE